MPHGGQEAGWYALHAAVASDPFVKHRLTTEDASLSYRQPRPGVLPPFEIYEQHAVVTRPQAPIEPAIPFGALSLVGYRLSAPTVRPGTSLEMETWWQVRMIPDRPLSLMLHIGAPDTPPVAVGDGLAVPVETWRPGDLLIQRHVLDIAADAQPGSYLASTGIYWLDTLERWPILDGPQQGATGVTLASIEIKER